MTKKISIIVPIYNSNLYLNDCIESIINQSYNNIEIILLNDGSTDNSLDICKKFEEKDKRIILVNKENSGVSDTRNMGIDCSTGEYISFVDSDDIIDKNYINFLVKNIDKTHFNIANKVSFNKQEIPNFNNSKYENMFLSKENFILLDKLGILHSPWGKLFDKKILDDYNIRFESDISLGEDLLFNLKYLKYIEKICVINNCLYYYRHTSGNSLGFKYRDNMEQIQMMLLEKYQEAFNECKDIYPDVYYDKVLDSFANIIKNEFKNKDLSFYKKIQKIRKFLSKHEVIKQLNECIHCGSKFKLFIFRHKLIVFYYTLLKIKRKI